MSLKLNVTKAECHEAECHKAECHEAECQSVLEWRVHHTETDRELSADVKIWNKLTDSSLLQLSTEQVMPPSV